MRRRPPNFSLLRAIGIQRSRASGWLNVARQKAALRCSGQPCVVFQGSGWGCRLSCGLALRSPVLLCSRSRQSPCRCKEHCTWSLGQEVGIRKGGEPSKKSPRKGSRCGAGPGRGGSVHAENGWWAARGCVLVHRRCSQQAAGPTSRAEGFSEHKTLDS